MIVIEFLIDASNENLLFLFIPAEPLALLAFGIGLIGATAGLRKILNYRDEIKTNDIQESAEVTKG
jgi:lipopolysaccharide export LptBFGC system permease protein LptF